MWEFFEDGEVFEDGGFFEDGIYVMVTMFFVAHDRLPASTRSLEGAACPRRHGRPEAVILATFYPPLK